MDRLFMRQHRICPAIASLTSEVFYNGLLQNAPAVMAQHAISNRVIAFNREYYGKDSARRMTLLLQMTREGGPSEPIGREEFTQFCQTDPERLF
jgi:hypothetical protein